MLVSGEKADAFLCAVHGTCIRVELHDVLWLALIWVALIAVWGASEHWDLLGAGRRVAQSIHHRGRSDGLPPLD